MGAWFPFLLRLLPLRRLQKRCAKVDNINETSIFVHLQNRFFPLASYSWHLYFSIQTFSLRTYSYSYSYSYSYLYLSLLPLFPLSILLHSWLAFHYFSNFSFFSLIFFIIRHPLSLHSFSLSCHHPSFWSIFLFIITSVMIFFFKICRLFVSVWYTATLKRQKRQKEQNGNKKFRNPKMKTST